VQHPDEARRKGAAARELMVTRYSPATVASLIGEELDRAVKKRGSPSH
jgi:hypothetical protein